MAVYENFVKYGKNALEFSDNTSFLNVFKKLDESRN